MKSLMGVLVAALAAAGAATDFPSDTLLPSRRVEISTATQSVQEEIKYAYARDAREWLYETKTWTYAGTSRTRVDVTVTDREGRYRGGSSLRTGNALMTFEPVYGPEGRMDRRIVRMDTLTAVEHYRYDANGNAVEMFKVQGIDTSHREFHPHTYDAEGRIATRKDFDEDSLNSTQVFRYDSQGRLEALIEYGNPWDLRDSVVYEYRTDGRVLREAHYAQFGGSPVDIVTWEYAVWQVPLSLVRPSRGGAEGSLAGYPAGRFSDPLGRTFARRAAWSPPHFHPRPRPSRP